MSTAQTSNRQSASVSDSAIVPAAEPLFFNRELSWLDFNQRVLELAQDRDLPLLERVKYLAIFSSNLDEFFMKRVGGLQRQRLAKLAERSLDGMTAAEQLDAIHARVRDMLDRQLNLWQNDLRPALAEVGVQIRGYDALTEPERQFVDDYFARQIFPILTPLAVDPGHPFPFISNLSKSMGVMLEHPGRPEPLFVRIKTPEHLPRYVPLPTRNHFIPVEQIIAGNLPTLFPGMKVLEHQLFRVTRNADIEFDEEDADDLLAQVEQELRRRRMAGVVRLELPIDMSPAMRQFIIEGMEVDPADVYTINGPIDMDDLMALSSIDLPDLKFRPWKPLVPERLRDDDTDMFAVIRAGDLLVHHPYEDFAASVERFIEVAAADPKVLAIKMTLYRTSSDSSFVPALIRAAEAGKQVAVLVEIKARFDEQRNVELAQRLEKAGVHVVYGLVGLKTHTKIAMVVREEPDGLRTYTHIGTGNYNTKTAQLYTDLGLFTCNPDITADVVELFHYLTGRSLKRDYRRLLVAPVNMRSRFLDKIAREADHARAGRAARIIAKMNQLQDAQISRAGVKIDLVVRGFCCLRPGVPGLSENIRVISILGRFLEHSRIFHFHNNNQPEFFIGSADWMVRNLDYRVEAITPIDEPSLCQHLHDLLDLAIAGQGHCWQLYADGTWRSLRSEGGQCSLGLQEQLMTRHVQSAKKARR
ncbi:MAG TPA: polyphosphate kinase 1 [Tepidisphaeraceae bacterium]|nr:polyphosphate kinase 1 [Tepidisphaeraceae bacterium]